MTDPKPDKMRIPKPVNQAGKMADDLEVIEEDIPVIRADPKEKAKAAKLVAKKNAPRDSQSFGTSMVCLGLEAQGAVVSMLALIFFVFCLIAWLTVDSNPDKPELARRVEEAQAEWYMLGCLCFSIGGGVLYLLARINRALWLK
jgi:hypothetical protein